jgi:hypothetical protein
MNHKILPIRSNTPISVRVKVSMSLIFS